jgi:hypothetical protein
MGRLKDLITVLMSIWPIIALLFTMTVLLVACDIDERRKKRKQQQNRK